MIQSVDQKVLVAQDHKWLVEHIFADDCKRLVDSLTKFDIEHHIISNPTYEGKWKHLIEDFVERANYEPDLIWCIDLCKTQIGNYYVLEIGLFGSAGLYHCDTDIIVKKLKGIYG